MHIFNIKTANLFGQKVFLANIIVNLKGEYQTFPKIDLLLEHHNRKFKYF